MSTECFSSLIKHISTHYGIWGILLFSSLEKKSLNFLDFFSLDFSLDLFTFIQNELSSKQCSSSANNKRINHGKEKKICLSWEWAAVAAANNNSKNKVTMNIERRIKVTINKATMQSKQFTPQ